VAALSYQGYHYSESTPFCGATCHTVMQPQYTAYQRSPHASVPCVACHVGGGATSFAMAKLSGVRQLAGVVTGSHSRPVPAPVEGLRSSRETCEQCHSIERYAGKRILVRSTVVDEGDPRDPQVNGLILLVGGKDPTTGVYRGIHWHAGPDNRVELLAADSRRTAIRAVRLTREDGTTTTWSRPDVAEPPAGSEWRVMDCTDCHNRIGHSFETAEVALDRELLAGTIDPTLPGIRPLALELLGRPYSDRDSARHELLTGLMDHYRTKHPSLYATRFTAIAQAAGRLYRGIYAPNVFPAMEVAWGTYPDHRGHDKDLGCYRCHDDKHKDPAGKAISQDCELCHTTVAAEERKSEISRSVRDFLFDDAP
jgi:hypothetical protein